NYFLFIIVDSYSKWPEVFKMNTITSKATIQILKELFARYGIPHEIVSDNGPQLVSAEFKSFLQTSGIKHRTSPEYYPQTNGQAERFVQTVKSSLIRSLEG